MRDASNIILRGKLIASDAYVRKEERWKIKICLKKLREKGASILSLKKAGGMK